VYAHDWVLNIKGITNKVTFEEKIDYDQPIIIMSTHCRAIDADTNFSKFGRPTNFIGKKSLFNIPLFGTCAYECGNIAIEREDRNQAVDALKNAALRCKNEKRVIGIFPEGTRRTRRSISDIS
jgi:1-acyl-sn-glycerol-3-phosphate acyltransferase